MNGLNIYYSGYRRVLNDLEKIENIRGSSGIQSFVIAAVHFYLKFKLGENYHILSNEVGLHIAKNNSLCADIAIFSKKNLLVTNLKDKYIPIAPDVVIEIDTKADFTNIHSADCFNIKTKNLLNFGVKKVIWIYTKSKKMMVATPKNPWLTTD